MQKFTRLLLACLTLVALMSSLPATTQTADAKPANVAGDWNLTIDGPNGKATPSASFKQDGEKLTGTYKGRFGEAPLTGTMKGNAIKFTTTVTTPNGEIQVDYSGTVDGDSMKGTVAFASMGDAPFTGKRKAGDAPVPK